MSGYADVVVELQPRREGHRTVEDVTVTGPSEGDSLRRRRRKSSTSLTGSRLELASNQFQLLAFSDFNRRRKVADFAARM